MTRVGSDEVRRVAALARIAVSDERAAALAAELDSILSHMDVLRAVDLGAADVEQPRIDTPLREDRVDPVPLAREKADFAPLARDGFFLVPRLATHDGEGPRE